MEVAPSAISEVIPLEFEKLGEEVGPKAFLPTDLLHELLLSVAEKLLSFLERAHELFEGSRFDGVRPWSLVHSARHRWILTLY